MTGQSPTLIKFERDLLNIFRVRALTSSGSNCIYMIYMSRNIDLKSVVFILIHNLFCHIYLYFIIIYSYLIILTLLFSCICLIWPLHLDTFRIILP